MGNKMISDKSSDRYVFTSADGTKYEWRNNNISILTLNKEEIENVCNIILDMTDREIQNDVSGNGIPMGVKIPLHESRLAQFLDEIRRVLKRQASIFLTKHAAQRLTTDMHSDSTTPNNRGWRSEKDVETCIKSVIMVNSARLTLDKKTLEDALPQFHSSLALEICGVRPDGSNGTLAIAVLDHCSVIVITLL